MGRNKLKQLIARNPVNRGLDTAFVDGVMRGMIRQHYPDITTIEKMKRLKYKRRIGKHNSTFIYAYRITGKTNRGATVQKNLMYSSHSDDSRLHAYRVLQLFIDGGFNSGDAFKVIVPLAYLTEVKALIYEEVPGRTLWDYMKKRTPTQKLYHILDLVASWLRKLHTFRLPAEQSTVPMFNPISVYWQPSEMVSKVASFDRQQAEKLQYFYDAWRESEKKIRNRVNLGITYGDPHPENIVIENLMVDGLTMIDFTDIAYGDQLRDCGIFIQQLRFMGKSYYSSGELEYLCSYFIERYFGKSLAALSAQELQRINLYQAWNALRSFIYLFHQDEQRAQSYGLLEDAWLYLTLAQRQDSRISIT